MLKLTALLLSVTLFVTGTMHAQTAASPNQNPPDLRRTIALETERIESESAKIDGKKLEKIERQRQTPNRSSWNSQKTIIIVTVAALVGLAVVLALTTKRCVKRSPEGCSFSNDVFNNCQCVEYAK